MILLLALAVVLAGELSEAFAASCPVASLGTVCAEYTEPTGVTNLKDVLVTITRDGVDLPAITVPASSATGGAVQSASVSTLSCVTDTYTAHAVAEYATPLGVMQSLSVSTTPGVSVVKDRTGEAACLKPVTNFTIR